jgi:methylmalonyl-CoA/ethylmalonyl-CoA epimerase
MEKSKIEKSPCSNGLLHVGVVVRDMDEAIKRLDALGAGYFESISAPPFVGKPSFRGKPSNIEVKGIMFKMGSLEIELIQPLKGNSPHKEFLDSKGEGIHHIAFKTTNLETDLYQFAQKGCSVLLSGKWQGGGYAYLDIGASNIIIELLQL